MLDGEKVENAADLIRAAALKDSGDTERKGQRDGETTGTAEDSSGVV